jgi:Ca2+/Na+ antiporter
MLREEVNLTRAIRIMKATIFILATISLLLYMLTKNQLGFDRYILIFFVLIFAYFILNNGSFKKFLYGQLIKYWFNGAASIQCPECENYVAHDNYCISCGYHLGSVIGYYKTEGFLQPTFVELNKNYIRVFKTISTRYSYERLTPLQYNINQMEDKELNWCGRFITTSRCFRFKYDGENIKIFTNHSLTKGLIQLFPHLVDNTGKGRFVWLVKQNKKKFVILLIILLLIVTAVNWYFTAKTDISIISTSSAIPGLDIQNATANRMLYGKNSVNIEGIVKNTNNNSADFIRLNATGYDQNGRIVDNQSFYVDLQKIPSGGYSQFDYFLDDYQQEIVSVKIEIIKKDFYL